MIIQKIPIQQCSLHPPILLKIQKIAAKALNRNLNLLNKFLYKKKVKKIKISLNSTIVTYIVIFQQKLSTFYQCWC